MPNSHRRRGRSVSRESRHHRRDVRSRSRESRSRGRISRSRGRESHNSRLDLQGNRIPRQPDIASNSLLTQQMQQILDRLTSLEEDRRVSRAASLRQPSNQQQQLVEETATTARDGAGFRDSAAPSSPGRSVSAAADRDATVTDRLIDAIRSINTTVRSNQAYFISNFDPSVNDIDTWCEEVDRAKVSNNWTDNECLSRIGNCLKGDSKTWLNEWVTSDRTWSNFIREFKPLCPRKPDVANILYEVMSTNSDRYPTYADYARRSLLRLRIVKGLSDELISAIVIRGVMDPQIRAAATNAKLMPNELVEYLSIYVKSNLNSKKYTNPSNNDRSFKSTLETSQRKRKFEDGTCFLCGKYGHKSSNCHKRQAANSSNNSNGNVQRNYPVSSSSADSNDDNAESTPEQAANVDTQPTIDTSPEPMPSTSRAAEALQPQPQENGDVLQSGEAVLAEE
ncbi:hypothetical protein HW555_007428 [Spodoptera exigua]|uniref:CCHC-type domain-containing protein n=1 Tax=Spodoptera exigua TaxID=7107 RepID=A0A835L2N8_SPOEX|nr:hypothetical protein HW555_009985 [Spodoptera exigua]KAF9414732.1 hypothetical protein HW555_007428 [Spodoptera exigua]KAH9638814.1 hypothetical protein HF086_011369 [Spodoptera exigua]KAH9642813.1 hypothetical protein HF086_012307 [Spodoptera exigua]